MQLQCAFMYEPLGTPNELAATRTFLRPSQPLSGGRRRPWWRRVWRYLNR